MTLPAPRSAVVSLLCAVGICGWAAAAAAQSPGPPPRDPTAGPVAAPASPLGTAAIRGRVVAADTGLPLRRVTVSLRSVRDPQGFSTTTDAAGLFTFEAVPKGRYRLKATKPRYVDAALGARRPGAPGRAFDLADGQTIEGVTVGLVVAGVIAGRVVDDAGEPVVRAMVWAFRNRGGGAVGRSVAAVHTDATDDTGTYRLFGLLPGRYYVGARLDSQGSRGLVDTSGAGLSQTYYPSTPLASEAQPVDVSAGVEAFADIALIATRVTTVSGTVVDAGGRPAMAGVVELQPVGGGDDDSNRPFGPTEGVTGDGRFTLSGVAPGDYTLSVHAFFDESELLKIAATGGVQGGGSSTMPLAVQATPIADLRVVVLPPSDVRGRLRFEGEPPPGRDAVTIVATPAGTREFMGGPRTAVGADGRFVLRMRPGSWVITPLAPKGWMPKALLVRGRTVDPTGPVEITGDPDERLEVVLTSQLTVVTGTARDANGAPVRDFHAVVFPAQRADPPHVADRARFERADTEGRFRFEGLPPGDYLIAALADFDPEEGIDDELVDSLRPGATPLRVTHGQIETLTVKLAALP